MDNLNYDNDDAFNKEMRLSRAEREQNEKDEAISNLITDWYIPEKDPLTGYVYPGPINIADKDELQSLTITLNELSKEKSQLNPEHDDFIVMDRGRIYRGHKINALSGNVFALRRVADRIPELGNLGLERAIQEVISHKMLSRGGLILIIGETGQGKSTTCAAAIKKRMDLFGSFCLTIEDPPELPLHGAHGHGRCIQTEVISGDFASALKGAMRSYPTVSGSMLYVGETRDSETAKEVLRIVTNGHLVFTTLHASDIVAGLGRFIGLATSGDMNEKYVRDILSSSLRLVLHQELKVLPNLGRNSGLRKRLDVNFLLSHGPTTPVAQKIKSGTLAQLSTDLDMQKTQLKQKGVDSLLQDWSKE